MIDPNAHCGYCGARYADGAAWPRQCTRCDRITYRNPAPVAVVLLPVERGLLVVKRGIPPQRGEWALPGGFIDHGESWQVAAAREVREETGVVLEPADFSVEAVHSTPNGAQVLIFARARTVAQAEVPRFTPSHEVSALDVIHAPRDLAFPLHTRICAAYFAALGATA